MLKVKSLPLSQLPNAHAYRFVGIRRDGSLAQCQVRRHRVTGMHYVVGEAVFADLIGWVRYVN